MRRLPSVSAAFVTAFALSASQSAPAQVLDHLESFIGLDKNDPFERELKQRVLRWQFKAYKQFEFQRNRDEHRERNNFDRSTTRLRHATQFANGTNRAWTEAAFRAAISQFDTSPAMVAAFQATVPPLPSDQFQPTSRIFDVLQPDGTLTPAPPVLVSRNRHHPMNVARKQFDSAWRELLLGIGESSLIAHEDLQAIRHTLDEWREYASASLDDADWRARYQAEQHLYLLGQLISAIEDPDSREMIRRYHYGNSAAFPGGTVADLLDHVLDNDLAVQQGSTAQLILAELSHDMFRDLEAQIELALRRMEYYKLQNRFAGHIDSQRFAASIPTRDEVRSHSDVATSIERVKNIITSELNRTDTKNRAREKLAAF